jgi:hypothetical protein
VVVNSAADEQQVDVGVQLESPGGLKHAAYTKLVAGTALNCTMQFLSLACW